MTIDKLKFQNRKIKQGIVITLLEKYIKRYFSKTLGYKCKVNINDISLDGIEDMSQLHLDVIFTMKTEDLESLLDRL